MILLPDKCCTTHLFKTFLGNVSVLYTTSYFLNDAQTKGCGSQLNYSISLNASGLPVL